jgi:uncharacterized protein (TIGR03435 family)
MKKLMLWMIALAALPGSALQAQNITGSWQGTLEAGPQKLRVVFKISLDDDKLKAVLYSIDQGGQPIPASTVTKDGSTVKIAIGGLGSYEGKLSGDGNSMAGTWTQGAPLPLNLARATPETAWTIPEPPAPPVRMTNANPGIEAATIKPSEPGRPGKIFTLKGKNVVTGNTTLSDLITMAYDLHGKQIIGLPAWADTDKYDITIGPDVPGQPNVAQMKILIQKLVADRFQLKFHREKKELAVYAITVGKTGSKITKSQADPDSNPGLFFGRAPQGMNFNVRNATLAEVASVLQGSVLDKPVVDQTGLSGKYDFTLKFTPDASQMTGFGPAPPAAAADPGDAPPDIFAAFEQQLGLKLESTKAPADVLVIDKVEKPSAN